MKLMNIHIKFQVRRSMYDVAQSSAEQLQIIAAQVRNSPVKPWNKFGNPGDISELHVGISLCLGASSELH